MVFLYMQEVLHPKTKEVDILLGLNADTIYEYLQYIADRRLERIGLKKVYESKNPFPWMSEIIDLRKEKNFFETRVNEYKIGSLSWD